MNCFAYWDSRSPDSRIDSGSGEGKRLFRGVGIALWLFVTVSIVQAGPPFLTDDPEPVEYQHWEVYVASQLENDAEGWAGTSPHFEINYGAVPNLQLHLIAPVSFVAPSHGSTQFGYGDTELGAKYRFVQETEWRPMIGTFPLCEVPAGDADRGLGSGHLQGFLPLWLQKSFGPWTTYGGGGYWINPGRDNRNWWFTGWLLQRKMTEKLTLGAEVTRGTPKEADGHAETRLNAGGIYDFSDTFHLLFSAGHTVEGPDSFQSYIGFQITFGPKRPAEALKK